MSPLIDPIGKSAEAPSKLSLRKFSGLDGKTIGLLDNGKPNADRVLDAIAELLQERYQVKEVVRRHKGNVSLPAPATIMEDLIEKSDVIIAGVGD